MIALHDDYNQHEIGKKKNTIRTNDKPQTLLQKLIKYLKQRKQRRLDRLALYQLIQLDDALLKDIGITRTEINAVRKGTLSIDAIVKHETKATQDKTGQS